ncbi:thiamine-phosphate kinase [Mesosutterella sp. OilRF-GAM-744-9]|uniref:Thiamine-monophosphate kinase n=1 Tax=Mesosutterella porci TaxID=2915351 RepID=A0ABS9MTB0_9BURK|nr:thiamine-phosphate kinase [Mesosutterella sp. oilRF-744-WT-GAM-9]MCG5031238.1 thiamine-phosphate kinase [Mesosutterella sp. oilRF-744-WT-GAM-9]
MASPDGEFSIIDRFFSQGSANGPWFCKGVGDDCAIIDLGTSRIAVTMDMLAVGTHFLPDADPRDIGYKTLAVNLSDLAAAGAVPRAFFLSIGLPDKDEKWLEAFSSGLRELSEASGCALLGGDTVRTPLQNPSATAHSPAVFSVTALGELPPGMGLTRGGARPGDDIWVSGTLGDAYAALKYRWGHWAAAPAAFKLMRRRMERPEPRNALGRLLLPIATAAIDVSDGFEQDLSHILERSHVKAEIEWDSLPRSEALQSLPLEQQQEAALSGGDDYELVFTAPADRRREIFEAGIRSDTLVTRVGKILAESQQNDGALTVYDGHRRAVVLKSAGFDHFA